MMKRALLLAVLPIVFVACPDPPAEGEGEGEGGEGEGEGDVGEGEGEGDVGGEGEGEGEGDACPIVDPCAGTANSGVVSFGGDGTVTVNGTVLTVGTTTRAQVDAALGAGAPDENAFRVSYCAPGVLVQYVDNDGVLVVDPAPNAADVVARVVTLPGSTATGGGTSVGGNVPATVPTATAEVGDGDISFFAAGLQILSDSTGKVIQLGTFKPQTVNAWTLPMTLENDDQALSTLKRGDTFADANALLGTASDAEGVITIQQGAFEVEIFVRIWAATGVRIAGACGFDPCGNDTPISSITVSPPFFGQDATVGIGSTRAEVEADVGAGVDDPTGIVVYGTPGISGDALGVLYVQDTQCVEHAAGFVFNFFNPNG